MEQAPLVLSMELGHSTQLVIAVLVGIGFGFALERAGFGRADNMVSNFYGRDFRVLRVMFTAVVVAMLGLYLLDLAAIMPIGNIGLLETSVWPQLVGGSLVGAAFIIGGYCPGTSLVGVASGKLDAVLFVAGIFAGTFVFTLGYDLFAGLHAPELGSGPVLLHEALGVPSGVMVMAVVLMAVGAFYGAGKLEARINARVAEREEGA